jgi:hypothetical protein
LSTPPNRLDSTLRTFHHAFITSFISRCADPDHHLDRAVRTLNHLAAQKKRWPAISGQRFFAILVCYFLKALNEIAMRLMSDSCGST